MVMIASTNMIAIVVFANNSMTDIYVGIQKSLSQTIVVSKRRSARDKPFIICTVQH